MSKVKLKIKNNKELSVDSGIKLYEVADLLNVKNAVGGTINDEIFDLNTKIYCDGNVDFVTMSTREGIKIYTAGLKYLLILAVRELYGPKANVEIKYSIDKGNFCTIDIGVTLLEQDIEKIKNKMLDLVNEELPIERVHASTNSVIRYFENTNQLEKAEYYKNYIDDTVSIYKLKDMYNYFFGILPINTKYLGHFDLVYVKENSFILMHPTDETCKISKYNNCESVLNEFLKYKDWTTLMKIPYVPSLNKLVSNCKIEEFILLNEMKQIIKMEVIIDKIIKNEKIKMILVAGPSSSGKTTTTTKFALHLKNNGKIPFVISLDNYFKNRDESPKNPDGTFDFECLEAIDLDLFNAQLLDLVNGKEIIMPTFNFISGKKEFNGKKVKLEKNQIIIIEGLHTLNEKLTKVIPRDMKFKIYASPFTPLGVDRHNHISTADIRLLRRIVRDNVTRGYSPEHTLRSWENVRKGEEQYVYPFQEEADATYNTILVYEIGVLKVFVEPLLHSISKDSEYYLEAKRLLLFLKSFYPIPDCFVPKESTLREFIGNGYTK